MYVCCMNNLKTGDVIHCRNKRIISRLIRWATRSKWSHTAIFIEVWGQPCVIEAQANGVNVKTWDNWVKKYGYTYEVHRSMVMENHKAFSKRALSKAGVTGYDLVSLLIRQPWKIITGSWKKNKREEDKMYCSEYAAWCHRIEESYQMTPDDLHKYLTEHNYWKIVDKTQ